MTLRIATCNLNGIRSATKKGFFDWFQKQDIDMLCVQETKAQLCEMQDPTFHLDGYHAYFSDAIKKGYSGVGIYSKYLPTSVRRGLGWPTADNEGRYIQLDFQDLSIASIYLPSGTSGPERQAEKFDFMSKYTPELNTIIASGQRTILCGDWNIAHKPIDLKNWRANQIHSGFLPEERAWLDELFYKVGWIDAFRMVNTNPDEYTWWSHRGQARAKNVGWRIDYQIVTPNLKETIRSAEIYRGDMFSDHAPLILEYDLTIR